MSKLETRQLHERFPVLMNSTTTTVTGQQGYPSQGTYTTVGTVAAPGWNTGTSFGYTSGWTPMCATCITDPTQANAYNPAQTLINGTALCTDCARRTVNIIEED